MPRVAVLAKQIGFKDWNTTKPGFHRKNHVDATLESINLDNIILTMVVESKFGASSRIPRHDRPRML
jgi:hypothetical protein